MTPKPKEHPNAPAPVSLGGHPRLCATSSHADLAAALQRSPGLLQSVASEADRTAKAICLNPNGPGALVGVAEFWMQASFQYQRKLPRPQVGIFIDQTSVDPATVDAFRIVLNARDLLAGLIADLPHVSHGEVLALRGHIPAAAAAQLISECAARLPGLAAWLEAQRIAREAATVRQQAQAARDAVEADQHTRLARRAAAIDALRHVLEAGVSLAVIDGNMTAHPAVLLTPQHRLDLPEYREEITSFMCAAPEAL